MVELARFTNPVSSSRPSSVSSTIRTVGTGITVTWTFTSGAGYTQVAFALDLHANGQVFNLINTTNSTNNLDSNTYAGTTKSVTIPWSWFRDELLLEFGGGPEGVNLSWGVLHYNLQVFCFYDVATPDGGFRFQRSDSSRVVHWHYPSLSFNGGTGGAMRPVSSRPVSWTPNNYRPTSNIIGLRPQSTGVPVDIATLASATRSYSVRGTDVASHLTLAQRANFGIEVETPFRLSGDPTEYNFYETSADYYYVCLLYTSPSPRDRQKSRMPSSA